MANEGFSIDENFLVYNSPPDNARKLLINNVISVCFPHWIRQYKFFIPSKRIYKISIKYNQNIKIFPNEKERLNTQISP